MGTATFGVSEDKNGKKISVVEVNDNVYQINLKDLKQDALIEQKEHRPIIKTRVVEDSRFSEAEMESALVKIANEVKQAEVYRNLNLSPTRTANMMGNILEHQLPSIEPQKRSDLPIQLDEKYADLIKNVELVAALPSGTDFAKLNHVPHNAPDAGIGRSA